MATSKQERAIIRAMNRALSRGVLAALESAAEGYRTRVTQEISPPTSDPGEFPHEDTGQGAANISFALKEEGVDVLSLDGPEGRMGVFGEGSPVPQFPGQDHVGGEHLDYLRDKQDRLGMDTSFAEDLGKIAAAFRRGARKR